MPTTGVRFDLRMLQLMDTDGDGRIRTPEVVAAVEFLKARGVNLDDLFKPSAEDEKRLAGVLERQADLAKVEPSAADKKAMADWEAAGKDKAVAFLGDATADAEAALAAVEGVVDAYFAPPEDMPLVTEEPDKTLPLDGNINPKHLEAILAFAAKCAKPVLGDAKTLDRLGWKKIKAAGVTHAIIRCGYSTLKGGSHNTDSTFANNLNGAYKAGIKVGVYYYSTAVSVAEAKSEAQYTISVIKSYKSKITLPVVFDYETGGRLTAKVMKSVGTASCIGFCDTIKADSRAAQDAGSAPA